MKKRSAREATQKPQSAEEVLKNAAEAAAKIAETAEGKLLFDYLHQKVSARSTYIPGDSHGTHFREGMRVLLLHIGYLIKVGRSGPTKVFMVAEEKPIWEQTRDVLNVREELSDGDYGD